MVIHQVRAAKDTDCHKFQTPERRGVRRGEALAQAAQRSCGCPLPGRVQGQVGWSSEHPGLVEDVPAHGWRVGPGGLEGPFQPKPFL